MKKLSYSLLAYLLATPVAALAAYEAPIVKIKTGTGSLKTIINNAISWGLGIVGATAVLFIIYGGFLYITAGGNKERSEAAKKTLTYAVGGLVVVIMAQIIVSLVSNSVGAFI